ncbi:MAG: indolepyruvate oxidoreductase subunit beta [Spirochaetota bacterium]|nr:MAG: indolepyruvate oxidoreductase subunit beta [Spirochaetota bacterium]
MDDIKNVLLVGVGGQGIILASTIISQAALFAGHDVKNNEVHGMAQRGGSVVSQIRFGKKVYSPLIQHGTANFVISLEKLETVRYLHFCNLETRVIVNNLEIVPVTVTSGGAEYPKNIDRILHENLKHVEFIDAADIARRAGNIKAANVVLIGAMSHHLPFEDKVFERAIEAAVKKEFLDMNLKAFYSGKEAIIRE